MAEPAHTPGPWKWTACQPGGDGLTCVAQLDGYGGDPVIADIGDGVLCHEALWPVSPADMALIAAAPELLAACKAVFGGDWLADEDGEAPDGSTPVSDQLAAAIAFAEPPEKTELAQAEACVLGSLILDHDTCGVIFPMLKADDFFYPANRIIFETLGWMYNSEQLVNLATLNQELAKRSLVAEVGGTNYLIGLAEGVPSTANAEYYANIVRDHARLRSSAEPPAASSGGQ